ncbi:membrane protein [Spirilliplanes yamanashiensis]|uniref:Membrane protein n=2 Tax=Spirilliplanes yamanashiensis TaxID=42233 RepID=A0A8J3Y707_9ACTN|nr:metallophosphoesterase [Spirilliplanes yamanashiensis]GIJ02544.1 membrane protein [Spirilliplanes yamanashiensis]
MGFAATLAIVVGLIHWYLYKRLVRDTLPEGWPRRAGAVAAVLLALLAPTTLVLVREGSVQWLAWPGFLWLALMFYLLVVLAVLEVPRAALLLWWRARRRRTPAGVTATPAQADGAVQAEPAAQQAVAAQAEPPGPAGGVATKGDVATKAGDPPGDGAGTGTDPAHDASRRLLLARGAAIFAGLTAAGAVGYGVRTALGPPQLDRFQVPMAKLPRAMDGTRIAVVSDIHLGPLVPANHAQRITDLINSVDADVVAIVGDLVDGTVEELGASAAPLGRIQARHGTFFVTGNHEYYSGHLPWIEEVQRLGIRVLRNEREELLVRGGALDLAGVNDIGGEEFGDGPDFPTTFAGRDPSRPVVLMAHQPVQARSAAEYGVDLQVSGHTHGGQMVPFNLLVKLEQPVVSGYGTVDGVPVYVTNGAGFWGPPVRVGAPPQVSLLELRAP